MSKIRIKCPITTKSVTLSRFPTFVRMLKNVIKLFVEFSACM